MLNQLISKTRVLMREKYIFQLSVHINQLQKRSKYSILFYHLLFQVRTYALIDITW